MSFRVSMSGAGKLAALHYVARKWQFQIGRGSERKTRGLETSRRKGRGRNYKMKGGAAKTE